MKVSRTVKDGIALTVVEPSDDEATEFSLIPDPDGECFIISYRPKPPAEGASGETGSTE